MRQGKLVSIHTKVGGVTLRGIRLCGPCSHLAKLTREDVLPAPVHRGGLRAEILSEGIIQVGDIIEVCKSIDRGESLWQ